MRFLLDENFPRSTRQLLSAQGHECFEVRGSTLEGTADTFIIQKSIEIKAIILTTDRDFFHTLPHQHPNHAGIIVIALRKPNRMAIIERLDLFLKNVPFDKIPGRSFQLRDSTWIAFPPIEQSDRD